MNAAMNVRILMAIIIRDRVDNGVGLLRGGGVVKIHQRAAVNALVKNRKIGANLFHIEVRRGDAIDGLMRQLRDCGLHAHPTSSHFRSRSCSAAGFANEPALATLNRRSNTSPSV